MVQASEDTAHLPSYCPSAVAYASVPTTRLILRKHVTSLKASFAMSAAWTQSNDGKKRCYAFTQMHVHRTQDHSKSSGNPDSTGAVQVSTGSRITTVGPHHPYVNLLQCQLAVPESPGMPTIVQLANIYTPIEAPQSRTRQQNSGWGQC